MKLRSLRQGGFTIIELLIVFVLIAGMVGVGVGIIGDARGETRDTERTGDLEAIAGHLNAYAVRNDQFPTTDSLNDASEDAEFISANFDSLSTEVFQDPSTGATYSYLAAPSTPEPCDNSDDNKCTGYILCADLEEDGLGENDPDDTCDASRTDEL